MSYHAREDAPEAVGSPAAPQRQRRPQLLHRLVDVSLVPVVDVRLRKALF